jgi:hypothetical protein
MLARQCFLMHETAAAGTNLFTNMQQYGLRSRLLDIFIADHHVCPLRPAPFLDAIVADRTRFTQCTKHASVAFS